MEETSQQEKIQGSEGKNQNEEEGGIRRRLRDRELLRKRKAEAEEKETNQVENQRKRSRAESKSGAKRRGRPRKTDPVPQLPVVQEEAGDPAVMVVPATAEVISGQILMSQAAVPAVEPQQAVDAPAPVLGLVRNSVLEKLEVDSAPAPAQDSTQGPPDPAQASYGPPVPAEASYAAPVPAEASNAAPVPAEASYGALVPPQASYAVQIQVPGPTDLPNSVQTPNDVPILLQAPGEAPVEIQASNNVPVQSLGAVPVRPPSQDSVPAAALAPPRVETLYTEPRGREPLDQVLIEDLGPDDEDEISPSQNNKADEGFDEMPMMNTAERNKMYSVPTLSGPPLPQEYLPGNRL